jgi:hypothetical protein
MKDNKYHEKKSVIPPYVVLGFILILLGVGAFVFIKYFVPDYQRRGMQEELLNGQTIVAQAEILAIVDTGRRYAKVPIIQFKLNVVPEKQKSFQLVIEQEVPWLQLNQMIPGKKIEIRYNPKKPDQALINQQ